MNKETVRDFKDNTVQAVNLLMPMNNLDLKIKINTLIWEEGPADMTLANAEIIACHFFKALIKAD